MRIALVLVLAGATARAEPGELDGIDVTAELDAQSTSLHSTDGGLSASGPRFELAADKQSGAWSFGAFAALSHITGDLAGTQYHIAISGGEYSVYGGVRLRGWAGSHVFGTIGLGSVRIMSSSQETSAGFFDLGVGVEPVRIDDWAIRLVIGADLYAFDSLSNTTWFGGALVYRWRDMGR